MLKIKFIISQETINKLNRILPSLLAESILANCSKTP